MSVRVGTTSWSDRSLVRSARFYPPEARDPESRLRYYATQFPVTEASATYYAIFDPEVAEAWAERTPPHFVFDVKAFRLFTQHRTPTAALPKDLRAGLDDVANVYHDKLPAAVRQELWRRFRAMLEPLQRRGKLGAVLLQFAPWFIYGPAGIEHIQACAQMLEGITFAIELRNKTWFSERNRERTLELERSLGAVNVVADEPQVSSFSVPAVWAVTNRELAIVRLHGRNAATWQMRDLPSAAERFDYLYSRAELRRLVEPIAELAERADEVHVLFNNCYRDNAQRNARTLMRMLEQAEPVRLAG